MKRRNNEFGLVYSTDPDWQPETPDAESVEPILPAQQDLRITLDKKLKGGKQATVIYRFLGSENELTSLAKHLKTVCGCGGTAKNGEIILQGNCLDKVKIELTRLGYRFKIAGI
ncbi:MAG: translation initiation factor [Bacteroidia bacterium]|nr:translation initiation factor [Bacteroidia bacterium]